MLYLLEIVWYICVFAIVAMSLNLVIGYTGMFHLGQVGFFALGSLGTTLATHPAFLNTHYIIGIIIGVLLSIVAAICIGIPTFKLRGDYFAIATLGFGEIVRVLLNSVEEFSGKPKSIDPLFETREIEVLFVFILLIFCIILFHKLVNSPFGRVLRAIRDDEDATTALGKNVASYKLKSFIISAIFASIAGSLFAHHYNVFVPNNYNVQLTLTMLIMVIIGGMGSNLGAVVGATIIGVLNEVPRFLHLDPQIYGPAKLLVFSVLIVVVVLFLPKGIMGETDIKDILKRLKRS